MRKLRELRLLATGAWVTIILLGLAPASASSANISHSYHATSSITNGSIVSLEPQRSGYIQLSNITNGDRLVGVALADNDSLLAVDPSAGTVQVATSGTVNTLVSTLNGNIDVGDQVSVSPFNGIGMKATPGSHVIGLAQTTLNPQSPGANTEQVKNKAGTTSKIVISYIRLSIATGVDTAATNTSSNSLQRLFQSITGSTVSTIRIVLSLVIAFVALIALIVLIYASVYSSIISVGRNPLAKYAITKTLGAVLLMALLTTVTASITIFFLLK
jgi:hypothetical protein